MRYLLDTGILLRLVHREAENHGIIRQAVRILKMQGHLPVTSPQNISEFWNVCTRPPQARGGLGLTLDEAHRRLRTIERIVTILPESPETYMRWKEFVLALGIRGVQVHDARIAALMSVHGVSCMITLNSSDFIRYSGLVVVSPEEVCSADKAQ